MKKWQLRLVTIMIFILGVLLQCLRLFVENIEWLSYMGMSIMCLGITLFVNTFEFNNHKSIDLQKINKIEFPIDEKTIFIEQHKYCERCGYTVEQAYSQPIVGFELNQTRGCKYNGKWHGKNTRKRKRMKRKYDIKHTNKDWMLFFI